MSRSRKGWWWLAALVASLALVSCGGDDGDDDGNAPSPEDVGLSAPEHDLPDSNPEGGAESPTDFVEAFERLTGVRLKPVAGDLFGTRLEVPQNPSRFMRFGAYQLVWARDDRKRDLFLGNAEPDDDDIYWRKVGRSYSANKAFGKHLMLRWVGRSERRTNEQWERLERAVEAAYLDKPSLLPSEERPCSDSDLDPFKGDTGKCALKGLPITFVNADDTLDTPVFEAQVRGIDTARTLRFPNLAPLVAKQGRFLIIAFQVRNASSSPLRFVHPELRFGDKTVPEFPEAAGLLPRKGKLPLAPGASYAGYVAYDVPSSLAGENGAFVFPAEREGNKDPSPELAQGWIRLAGAHQGLPRETKPGTLRD